MTCHPSAPAIDRLEEFESDALDAICGTDASLETYPKGSGDAFPGIATRYELGESVIIWADAAFADALRPGGGKLGEHMVVSMTTGFGARS